MAADVVGTLSCAITPPPVHHINHGTMQSATVPLHSSSYKLVI